MAILFGKTNMNCKKNSSDAHAGKPDPNFTYTEFVNFVSESVKVDIGTQKMTGFRLCK